MAALGDSSAGTPVEDGARGGRRIGRSIGTRTGLHVKDKLENKLHDMVCSGAISLRNAQRQIAANWRGLYLRVFGSAPTV